MSRYYDLSQNAVLFGDTLLPVEAFLTPDSVEAKLVSAVFDFAKSLAELKLSEIQLALYSAFVLLSSGNFLLFFLIDGNNFDVGSFLIRSNGTERYTGNPTAGPGRFAGAASRIIPHASNSAERRHLCGRFPGRQTSGSKVNLTAKNLLYDKLFLFQFFIFWKQGNLWTSHGGAGQVQTSHASPRIPRPAQGTLFRRQLRRRQCPGIITPSLYSWKLFKTFRFNLVGARE